MGDTFETEPQPTKSSSSKILIVLAIVGGVFVLLCGSCIVGGGLLFRNAVSNDPTTVRQTAQQISEIELPEGYQPMFSMKVSFVDMAMATFGEPSSDPPRMLMLMSFPSAMAGNEDQMRQSMEQNLQKQTGKRNLTEVESESRTYSVRGEDCQFLVAVVKDDEGRQIRQVTGFFSANGSPAMLMVMMPDEEWNDGGEAALEATFASMQ